ncbi:helix-turn-helix domain-containing protein [Priestia endophytica]
MLKQKGMTMTELHEITGISQNALSLISNGKNNGI